jgi:hypothetical protein
VGPAEHGPGTAAPSAGPDGGSEQFLRAELNKGQHFRCDENPIVGSPGRFFHDAHGQEPVHVLLNSLNAGPERLGHGRNGKRRPAEQGIQQAIEMRPTPANLSAVCKLPPQFNQFVDSGDDIGGLCRHRLAHEPAPRHPFAMHAHTQEQRVVLGPVLVDERADGHDRTRRPKGRE